ncbi:hypothetical protein [Paenibacillus eucommiae]|uniref:Uncharacterized protein n=1 Tax=Paenibacillus eucommiae TaxID=1355755 RepID=A0ABS4IRL0_9BACL|nr:hypothetical protein [Paenibacillus eucommiae]MBP1990197.1 hypothetical protein [Paenibacillus eucommiae]
MDGLTTMIAANGFGRASKAYVMNKVANGKDLFVVKATNASDPERNSLSVTINPKALDNTNVNNLTLTGSLTHAWLHREGYRHPVGKFTSKVYKLFCR